MIYFRFIQHLLRKWWQDSEYIRNDMAVIIVTLSIVILAVLASIANQIVKLVSLMCLGVVTGFTVIFIGGIIIVKIGEYFRKEWDKFDKRKVKPDTP